MRKTALGLPKHGIIAVLDALGAANYSDTEIRRFMRSRELVLDLLKEKAENMSERLSMRMITTFTFNDTVLVVLRTEDPQIPDKVIRAFLTIMRKFLVDSIEHGILFRGALAIGNFHIDETTNTILGPAVTDAASWYDRADWVGLICTPRTTIHVQHLIEQSPSDWARLITEYPVPLTDGATQSLYTVNWPRLFLSRAVGPVGGPDGPRARLLGFLRRHAIPTGAERKFFNSIAFFDQAIEESQS